MLADEDDIDRIRKRPGMYAGEMGLVGLHNLLQSILLNAIEEARTGHGNKIEIRLNDDGSCTVRDEGRGIPVDVHAKFGLPAAEVIVTKLHSPPIHPKDNRDALTRIGFVVVNALSEWLELRIRREGREWYMRFNNGKREAPIRAIGFSKLTGTEVTFLPSREFFPNLEFDYATVEERVRRFPAMKSDICLTLTDARNGPPKSSTFSI